MTERTAVRGRTRRALLLAGIEVLSDDASATLGKVAERAGVARSTLHRHFPDRRSLTTAISAFVMTNYEEAFSAARTEEDTGLEAFRRVCLELMERLEILAWWMGMGLTAATQEDETATAEIAELDEGDDERLTDLVTRGHEDGSIDPQLGPSWVEGLLWATLYSARHLAQSGAPATMPAHDVRAQALRSLLKAVAADPATV